MMGKVRGYLGQIVTMMQAQAQAPAQAQAQVQAQAQAEPVAAREKRARGDDGKFVS